MTKFTNKPTISVIVPVFNTAKYLTRCLDSIINQDIKGIEIIIVNDMSTDNSEDIILGYTHNHDFIKYFKMQSKGLAGGSRNLGLQHATGKFIGFVDSDDWADTAMFKKMVKSLEEHDADIAVCGVITEYPDTSKSEYRYKYSSESVIDGSAALNLLTIPKDITNSISPIVCNKVYRSTFLEQFKHTFPINNHNDDDVFNFICFLTARKVIIVPDVFYHYFQRKNSIMHVFSLQYIDDLIAGFSIIKNYLITNHIYESHKAAYYSFFDRCLASILTILISSENNPKKHAEVINYVISKYQDILIPSDYLDTISIQRIIKFLTCPNLSP